jgi:Zn-dependent protease with chaperone function
MNFSRHQQQAQRAARRLLWLFGLATLTVVLAVNLLAALAWNLIAGWGSAYPTGFFLTNTLVVTGMIVGGSLLETVRLREGGAVIAERLGAVAADATDDPLHRRLRNIVEELSIAARIGVPRAFVIADEPSINALAAGIERNDSVVIVTQGALQRLTRDELQGVVAHEISHIVNGDVGLNTRLVGLNYGLELVALFGRSMLSQVRLRPAATREPVLPIAFGAVPLLVAGVVLTGVGSLGELAARAIRSGVGRQREFHADAQAVGFTRNRDGLGGALRKAAGQSRQAVAGDAAAARRGTGGAGEGDPEASGERQARLGAARMRHDAVLRHPYWENVSHLLLIGPSHGSRWTATHPGLDERIRRLYGRRLGPLEPAIVNGPDEPALPALGRVLSTQPLRGEDDAAIAWAPPASADDGARLRSGSDGSWALGPLADIDVQPADDGRTPPAVRLVQATRAAGDAAALVAAMMLQAPGAGSPAWPVAWRAVVPRADELMSALRELPPAALRSLRWPLMELACARLRTIAAPARLELLSMLREVVVADGRVTLQEWIFFSLLRLRLTPRRGSSLIASREPLAADAQSVRLLFNLLAHCTHVTEVRADRAANVAIRALDLEPIGGSAGAFTLESLERAVERIDALPPLAKPLLIRYLVAMLPHDSGDEVRDFVRLLCVAIDCPPPRLPKRAAAIAAEDDFPPTARRVDVREDRLPA